MTASILHGAPGSFKSSSVVWYELLGALRAGRLVVTNVEGMLPKEEIEIVLNEVFPKTAEIFRLSSQTDVGLDLWRRWFWWMPVKAFVLIDEVQDVFPNDRADYKPENYNAEGIESLKTHLPQKFYDRFWLEIKSYSKEDITSQDSDDTGELIFDENGHIIYPRNMREANMRHRKYNWDIFYCTPEITEIHKLVRTVCEFAYKHKYFKGLTFIPWFKNRPRTHEHNPKTTGEVIRSGEPKRWRKVPNEVFELYKSTSTGGDDSGGGVNPFKSASVILIGSLLLITLSYLLWWLLFEGDDKNNLVKNKAGVSKVYPKNTNANSNNDSTTFIGGESVALTLPFNANGMRLTGMNGVYKGGVLVDRDYVFELENKDEIYSINSDDLEHFGIKVRRLTDCLVQIYKGKKTRQIMCKPTIINEDIEQLPRSSEV